MDTSETGGTPVIADNVVPETLVPTPVIPDSSPNTLAPAESDSTNTDPNAGADSTSTLENTENKDLETRLREEVTIVASTVLNRKTQETVDHLATLDLEGKKAFLTDNPHAAILVEVDFLRKLSAERVASGSIALDNTDPKYTFEGQTLGSITAITGDEFTCSISGSIETTTITRDQLIAVAISANVDNVLANFTSNSAEHKLISTYFQTSAPESEMTSQQVAELPGLITEVAKAQHIPTTETIIKSAEDYYKEHIPPEGASPEEIQRINEENERSRQLLDQIRTQYQDQNLAPAEDLDQILGMRGLTKEGLGKKIDTLRMNAAELTRRITGAKTNEDKDRLKKQLDTQQATIQVYEDIHKNITKTNTRDYLAKLHAGHIPTELGAKIINAIETGDMSALVLMVSPEADINATAEQKTKAREARETFDRNVKTIGIIAALAALLIALGISQSAKQQ